MSQITKGSNDSRASVNRANFIRSNLIAFEQILQAALVETDGQWFAKEDDDGANRIANEWVDLMDNEEVTGRVRVFAIFQLVRTAVENMRTQSREVN